jgi:hypothetical protein
VILLVVHVLILAVMGSFVLFVFVGSPAAFVLANTPVFLGGCLIDKDTQRGSERGNLSLLAENDLKATRRVRPWRHVRGTAAICGGFLPVFDAHDEPRRVVWACCDALELVGIRDRRKLRKLKRKARNSGPSGQRVASIHVLEFCPFRAKNVHHLRLDRVVCKSPEYAR